VFDFKTITGAGQTGDQKKGQKLKFLSPQNHKTTFNHLHKLS
jgi:hypothetical protein